MTSRADTHDLDKLRRWQQDLEDTSVEAPPVFAIFLVGGEDRRAHDVFRAFRTGFEERKLGFAHLVIFGQHGVSETATKLRVKFGLVTETGPQLVLFSGEGNCPEAISLPPGEDNPPGNDADAGWPDALERAIEVIQAGSTGEAEPLETLKGICAELLGQRKRSDLRE